MNKFTSNYFNSFNLYVTNKDIQLYEENKLLAKTTFKGDIEKLNFKRVLAAIDYIIHKGWKQLRTINKSVCGDWIRFFVSKDSIFQEICRKNYILKFNELSIDELILALDLLSFKSKVFTSDKYKNAYFNVSSESIIKQPKQASLF